MPCPVLIAVTSLASRLDVCAMDVCTVPPLVLAAAQSAGHAIAAKNAEEVSIVIKNPHLAWLTIGGSVLVVALFSSWLRRKWITGPMVCLAVGMVLGPLGLHESAIVDWPHHAPWVELVARITLAVSLMGVALHLPRDWLHWQWRPALLFLLLAMFLMWAATTLVLGLVLDVGWLVALLIAAVITPTDPVLATTIVTGKLAEKAIPGRLRNLLHAESAANDGLAFAFVMAAVLLMTKPTDEALYELARYVIAWQVLGATAVGALAGWLVGLLQRKSSEHQLAQYASLLAVSLALAVMVVGGIRAVDGDGVLSVFAAGVAFRLTIPEDNLFEGEAQIQETVQRLFQLPIFVLLGMMLPWAEWCGLGWRAVALLVGLFALRRIPAILLIKPIISPIHHRSEALFCGWFGPVGISAVFYAAMTQRQVHVDVLWPVVSLVVTASTIVHGLTATPYARHLEKSQASEKGD